MGIALVGALCVAAGTVSAQTVQYTQLPAGFVPTGVSADGQTVVGFTDRPATPYLWTQATGLVQLLGPSGETLSAKAWAASADGTIITGTLATGGQRPFRWTASTGIVAIPVVVSIGNGYDISDDGAVIVGDSSIDRTASGLVWDSNGVTDLFPPVDAGRGSITAISGNGRYAIGAGAIDDNGAYIRWDLQNNSAETLHLIDSNNAPLRGLPFDVNYEGDIVVGVAHDSVPGGGTKAIMWTVNGQEFLGGVNSRATAVNGDGTVVGGWMSTPYDSWISTPGVSPMSLVSYLSTYHSYTAPAQLRRLVAISDDGLTIVGGYPGVQGWVIRLPQPQLADFNRDEQVDFHDLSDFLDCFEGSHLLPTTSADLNRDGFTDFFDLIEFLDRFDG